MLSCGSEGVDVYGRSVRAPGRRGRRSCGRRVRSGSSSSSSAALGQRSVVCLLSRSNLHQESLADVRHCGGSRSLGLASKTRLFPHFNLLPLELTGLTSFRILGVQVNPGRGGGAEASSEALRVRERADTVDGSGATEAGARPVPVRPAALRAWMARWMSSQNPTDISPPWAGT